MNNTGQRIGYMRVSTAPRHPSSNSRSDLCRCPEDVLRRHVRGAR